MEDSGGEEGVSERNEGRARWRNLSFMPVTQLAVVGL